MARLRCNTCQGEYDDVSDDGVPYFHACPPVTRVRVKRDGEASTVDLGDVRPTDTVRVRRGDQELEVRVDELQRDDQRVGDVTRERLDRRDENTARAGGDEDLDRTTGRRRRIRARGRGVTVIDDAGPRSAP
jgi:hypothetical protein